MSNQADNERYLKHNGKSDHDNDDDDDDEDDEDYSPANDHNDEDQDQDSDSTDQEDSPGDDIETKKTADVKIDPNKLDELWNDFCSDQSTVQKCNQNEQKSTAESNKVTMTKEFDFAGEIVLIKETVDASNLAAANPNDQQTNTSVSSTSANSDTNRAKRTSGLSGLLTQLKKPKISTLKKSLHDWSEYKESNRLEDELDQHRRSKGSFLERQAFLSRTDVREFEREKTVRDRQRKLRDLKQQND
ncbi:chromatin regulator yeti-like protein [Euroglyphus maynei]|uniref:Craniofacial development protein 1 n=1 Tax=Euroglyphus maynei TaxID=6958 RepID=A0A1Y3AZN6_EURMA|nr:chromatin regulator yeti-like protein [Euroglyphus maynei]